jgi:multisubunit Na+/H+ antiporter MnhB subunit
MSIVTIATIVFFLVYGISHFYPFKHADKISAIAAIVVGVLMLVRF